MSKGYIQQGDVVMERVNDLPNDARKRNVVGRVILAEGEATGHAHAIDNVADVEVYDALTVFGTPEQAFFLKVEADVEVVHEEHGTVILEPGVWKVRQVREYDHFAEEARVVRD